MSSNKGFRELRHQDGNNSAEIVDFKPQTLTKRCRHRMQLDQNPPSPNLPPTHTHPPPKDYSLVDVILFRLWTWWLMLGLCSWCLTEFALLRSLASMHSTNQPINFDSHLLRRADAIIVNMRESLEIFIEASPLAFSNKNSVCLLHFLPSVNPPRQSTVVLHWLANPLDAVD